MFGDPGHEPTFPGKRLDNPETQGQNRNNYEMKEKAQ